MERNIYVESEMSRQASQGDDIVMGSLRDGWDAFKDEWMMVYGIGIVYLIVVGILSALSFPFRPESGDSPGAFYLLYQFVSTIIQVLLGAGASYALLGIVQNDASGGMDRLFAGLSHLVPLLVATLLTWIAVGFGFILLIIPGIVISLGLSQVYYLILDRQLGAVEAMQASWAMMRGYKMSLLVLGIASLLIVLVSLIPFGLGLLVSVPTVSLATAAFYDRLLKLNPPSGMA